MNSIHAWFQAWKVQVKVPNNASIRIFLTTKKKNLTLFFKFDYMKDTLNIWNNGHSDVGGNFMLATSSWRQVKDVGDRNIMLATFFHVGDLLNVLNYHQHQNQKSTKLF